MHIRSAAKSSSQLIVRCTRLGVGEQQQQQQEEEEEEEEEAGVGTPGLCDKRGSRVSPSPCSASSRTPDGLEKHRATAVNAVMRPGKAQLGGWPGQPCGHDGA